MRFESGFVRTGLWLTGPLGSAIEPGVNPALGSIGRVGPTIGILRKEVIQPQVPLRLPCYDFIPITIHTFGAF